jgi:hypothetical protein
MLWIFNNIFYTLFKAIQKYEIIAHKMKVSSMTPIHKPNKPKDDINCYRFLNLFLIIA